MRNYIDMLDYIYDTLYLSDSEGNIEADTLRRYTIEGNWKEVENLYNSDPKFSTIKINKSRGTALHVAVNEDNEESVRNLVASIISHEIEEALECVNEKGDTPLHLAASRGFKDICKCIIGENGERKHLIDIYNNDGETPLFLAALSCQKQTFVYLFKLYDYHNPYNYYKFIRCNGDSILHCAIRREVFDLALIIINNYSFLTVIPNEEGFSPLKLLATRPSAFKSGCKMIWWKWILYHCIPVGTLNVEDAMEYYGMKQDKSSSPNNCPANYDTCYLFFQKCKEKLKGVLTKQTNCTAEYGSKDMGEKPKPKILREYYATCLLFMKLAFSYILGVLGIGVEEIKKMKQKHKWSGQLLNRFMESPYQSYSPIGTKQVQYVKSACENSPGETEFLTRAERGKAVYKKLESETAILTAAKNGIVEIVNELITKIPSSIYDVNLENKNVLLLAVENRRTNVVEALRKRFKEGKTEAIFDNLIQGVDKEENTVLHLAATMYDDYNQDGYISGSAFKMMWNIKWFEYTNGLVPEHFTVRTNKKNKTAGEIFKKTHATLEEYGNAWFKDISESCSVVAVLLAGVAFATSSTVPGGNKSDTGEPTLKGKPAFDTFAMSSLIGLCFSVAALIMFLAIITSKKEAKDFRVDLPRKLLLGLSSLFLSMVALFVAFCSTHFFLIDDKFKHIVFLIYSVTCFPLTLYAVSQLPLYIELLRNIFIKVPKTGDKEKDV
ncbi:uncharacterized protein LOC131662285 [Vicia villosa]|uniref:uncharacterized protein LOC131662285 n=1 Tax=Vicia villosa TaxID=3911 RepID=UPI00273C9266|nr:uncharacterized protein LOC131662285 [Vicia villosa]